MSTATFQYLGDLRVKAIHSRSQSELNTDAPTDNHGLGQSFSPTDLTGVSLVTCMLTVMGIEANKRNIDLGKPTATFVKHMTSKPRKIETLEVTIKFDRDFDQKDKDALELRAKDCPVALSLHPDVNQDVEFVYPG